MDLTLKKLRSAAGSENTIIIRTQYNPLQKESCGGPSDPLAQLAQVVLEGNVDPFLVRGLNDRIREMAIKHGAKVADIFMPFALNPEDLIDEDCVHPTDAGHRVISDAFIYAF